MRDAAQQPDEMARLRRRIAELEAQLADAQGHAPLAAVEGVPAVLVHAVANAPEDGQVVRLERGVIAVVGPGGHPGEVWDAIRAAMVPQHPGPGRSAAPGAPGALRVYARRFPEALRAVCVRDADEGIDLSYRETLLRGELRIARRKALRATRLRPVTVAGAAVALARFGGRAVSVSRAHFGHAALAAGSLTAAATAAFVLLPATSPAPASPGVPAAASPRHSGHAITPVTAHRQALGRRHHAPAPATAHSRSASPASQAAASPSGLLPSLLPSGASPSGLVSSLLPSPPVSVSASPSSSGSAGGVCAGVLVLGVCVTL